MTDEYELLRHSAYIKGWCQAFGEHESVANGQGGYWLFDGDQVGLLLAPELGQELLPDIRHVHPTPPLTLGPERVQVGQFEYTLTAAGLADVLGSIKMLLSDDAPTHIYLTSHFMYGPGPQIVTFSNKRPLSIFYKEIGPMQILLP